MSEQQDHSDFESLMKDIAGLKKIHREDRASDIQQANKSIRLDETKQAQRKAALGEAQGSLDVLKTLKPEGFGPKDIMGFKKPGVQEGVYKKLRTGRYTVEAKLDLHGLTLDQALNELLRFVAMNMKKNKRCLLVSHGKGLKQQEPARMKNHVAAWLKQIPEVMAYHSAMPQHGGTGSVYVLLKKSEASKQDNRERFNQSS